jgi:hypothetical protein
MPYCPKCGKQTREDALFCSNCGASLTKQPMQSYGRRGIFRRYEGQRGRLREIVDAFREKGAVNPDKAMTSEELGLPLEFKERMKRRLGQTGIFMEVNGKYYLDEKRLEEIRTQISSRRGFRRW